MLDDVKRCINMRVNHINEYFQIPEDMEQEVSQIFEQLNDLGEQCKDAVEFEGRFANEGYMERYNSLFMKLKPKAVKSKKEILKDASQNYKEMYTSKEGLESLAEDAVERVAVKVSTEKDKAIREKLIDMDLADDVTRARNASELVKDAFKFFKKRK